MTLARPLAVAALAVAAVALAAANTATAGLTTSIAFKSNGSQNAPPAAQGKFTGTITYEWFDKTSAELTIKITNTTGGVGNLNALAFNNPGDNVGSAAIKSVDLSSANPATFQLKFDNNAVITNNQVDANPYTNFDFLLSTDGTFTGGGSGTGGLLDGQTGTFVISLTGTGLDALTAKSFTDELSVEDKKKDRAALLARFQGLEGGGSDKVPGVASGPLSEVPEPSLMAMGAAGVAGLGFIRRRFGKKTTA